MCVCVCVCVCYSLLETVAPEVTSAFLLLPKWSVTIFSKEVFYLMTHSTHFIYGFMVSGHMVEDHSNNEKKLAAATWATHSN